MLASIVDEIIVFLITGCYNVGIIEQDFVRRSVITRATVSQRFEHVRVGHGAAA